MRAWPSGQAVAFQATYAGSNPAARSSINRGEIHMIARSSVGAQRDGLIGSCLRSQSPQAHAVLLRRLDDLPFQDGLRMSMKGRASPARQRQGRRLQTGDIGGSAQVMAANLPLMIRRSLAGPSGLDAGMDRAVHGMLKAVMCRQWRSGREATSASKPEGGAIDHRCGLGQH
jgi:hypothetical protein